MKLSEPYKAVAKNEWTLGLKIYTVAFALALIADICGVEKAIEVGIMYFVFMILVHLETESE